MKKFILSILLLCSVSVFAEASKKKKGGDEFRATAEKYEIKAKHCLEKGEAECSKILFRMAAIKKNAAQLADEGKWDDISWDEYYALQKKLHEQRAKYGVKNKKSKK